MIKQNKILNYYLKNYSEELAILYFCNCLFPNYKNEKNYSFISFISICAQC